MSAVLETTAALSGEKKDQVKTLLGKGMDRGHVALAVGISESYISQLLADPAFAGEVQALRYNYMTNATAHDEALDALEHTVVDKLNSSIAFVVDPLKLTRMLQVINAAKRRGAAPTSATGSGAQVVELVLPTAMMQVITGDVANVNVQTNAHSQVVAVDGRSMATAQAHVLPELANKLLDNVHNKGHEEPSDGSDMSVPTAEDSAES